ncbi:MAG: DUF2304 domain-containing protein [Spirochaetota bacterium]|nr:DUF2304 domain-containing protein [Spirochaetota bacterium]
MENNQILAIIINLFLLGFIINSIKKGKLKEKYALLWIFSALTFILFSAWFEPIVHLAKLIGIINPINLLFMFGGIYLIFIVLHFSFALSKSHDNYKTMAQRVALLEDKLKKHKDENN